VGKTGEAFLEHLANSNNDANPELMRLALKLATGAGKTTVMAMLIAWQAINAARGYHRFKLGRIGFPPAEFAERCAQVVLGPGPIKRNSLLPAFFQRSW
jgi:hypothetical protein